MITTITNDHCPRNVSFLISNNNNNNKTCTLIDVAIPADGNVVQKEAENKLK
jgi:hypothetical protein